MLKALGETVAKMEQREEAKAQNKSNLFVASKPSNSVLKSVLCSQDTIADQNSQTSSIAQNDFSSWNDQPSSSAFLLNSLTSSVDLSSETSSFAQNNSSYLSNQSPSSSTFSPNSPTADVDSNSETFSANEQAKVQELAQPNWILQVPNSDQFKNFFFNCSQFDVNQLLVNSPFLNWYKEKLDSTNWLDFNLNINILTEVCVKELETYYSTKQKPKQTRLMHSTERHHLSAIVAFQLPQLVTKYAEFQLQHLQKSFTCSRFQTSPFRPTFMVKFG